MPLCLRTMIDLWVVSRELGHNRVDVVGAYLRAECSGRGARVADNAALVFSGTCGESRRQTPTAQLLDYCRWFPDTERAV